MNRKSSNNLVGRRVLIDWPMRWKDCRPEFQQSERKRAEENEPHFGETGEIVAYNPGCENGEELEVKLDRSGQIESFHTGAVTLTSDAPDPQVETNRLLREILTALTK